MHLHCSVEEENAVSKRTIKWSNDVDESTKRVSVWAEVCDGTVRFSDGAVCGVSDMLYLVVTQPTKPKCIYVGLIGCVTTS